MRKQILLFLGFIFIFANVAAAQKRTVTNADLEKFRQKRLQAEADYRENYQKLGLPSPEELDRQRDQNRREMAELSARFQRENFERAQRQREDEYMRAQIDYFRASASQYNQSAYNGGGYYSSGYYGGYYGGYSNGYYNNRFGYNRGFGRAGSFYNPIIPGTAFYPRGVRINTGGLRINVTGGNRFPARIGNAIPVRTGTRR